MSKYSQADKKVMYFTFRSAEPIDHIVDANKMVSDTKDTEEKESTDGKNV
jgi:hypothetical protein